MAFPGVTDPLETLSLVCFFVPVRSFHMCPGTISKGALSTGPEVTLEVCELDLHSNLVLQAWC